MARVFRTAERGMELFFAALPLSFPLAFAFALGQMVIVGAFHDYWLMGPLFVYAHAWFVMILTGWCLRRYQAGFSFWGNFWRAAILAVPIAAAMGAVFMALTFANDSIERANGRDAGDVIFAGDALFYSWQANSLVVFGRQLNSAIWMVLWLAAVATGIPARLMSGRRVHLPLAEGVLTLLVTSAPWMIFAALVGWPSQVCTGECWGLMEGGIIMIPLFGAYLFTLSASCAAVSAVMTLAHEPVAQSAQSG